MGLFVCVSVHGPWPRVGPLLQTAYLRCRPAGPPLPGGLLAGLSGFHLLPDWLAGWGNFTAVALRGLCPALVGVSPLRVRGPGLVYASGPMAGLRSLRPPPGLCPLWAGLLGIALLTRVRFWSSRPGPGCFVAPRPVARLGVRFWPLLHVCDSYAWGAAPHALHAPQQKGSGRRSGCTYAMISRLLYVFHTHGLGFFDSSGAPYWRCSAAITQQLGTLPVAGPPTQERRRA